MKGKIIEKKTLIRIRKRIRRNIKRKNCQHHSPHTPSPFAKKGVRMGEMMELFKQVQINLLLLDAIKQVPSYAKFLKDLCTKKRRLRTHVPNKVLLTQQVSALLMNKLPSKLKDLGAPIISCIIGDLTIERALLDLGASMNVFSSFVYDCFSLGEFNLIPITLQFSDKSVKVSHVLIQDVLVKVDQFYFLLISLSLIWSQHTILLKFSSL